MRGSDGKPDLYELNKSVYTVPTWALKKSPPSGYKLQIYKDAQLISTVNVDEKPVYYLGRQQEQVDIVTEHASCSRTHAILMFHHTLDKWYLVDLKSVHGTYVGKTKLEPKTPTPISTDVGFRLGASTRLYKLFRESLPDTGADEEQSDSEYKQITNKNTKYNELLHLVPLVEGAEQEKISNNRIAAKKVEFKSNVEIVNPEEIDPTVGRYRNLVKETIVVGKNGRKRKSHDEQIYVEPCKFEQRNSAKKYQQEKWPSSPSDTSQALKP